MPDEPFKTTAVARSSTKKAMGLAVSLLHLGIIPTHICQVACVSYQLEMTSGSEDCASAGWPKQVTVIATWEGSSGCSISGSALSGVFCDQPFQLSLTVTDAFSNSR